MVEPSGDIHPIFDHIVSRKERENYLSQKSKVFWFTGLSGSGKSTIAQGVEKRLFDSGFFAQVIDGDNIRTGISNNLSFSIEDRTENIRRVSEVARLYTFSGIISLCSFISPTKKIRELAKGIIGTSDFFEIYVKCSLEDCEKRDVKGLYRKARQGKIAGFTGIDSPYEPPVHPNLEIDTGNESVNESIERVYNFVRKKVMIS